MLSWTKAQWDAFGRHILTAVTSAFAALVLAGVLTSDKAAEYIGHISVLVSSVAGIAVLVGPIYAAWRSARSASPEKQAEQTIANLKANVPINGEKDKLIAAVAEQPDVRKVVMRNPAKADEIDSSKVTAQ